MLERERKAGCVPGPIGAGDSMMEEVLVPHTGCGVGLLFCLQTIILC